MHAEIGQRLDELARVVGQASPERTEVAAARLALAKASSRRRVLLQTLIFPNLRGLTAAEHDDVKLIERRCAELMQMSSQHIGQWTLDAVMNDLAGYRRGSADMRRLFMAQLALEQRLLYPILERKGDRREGFERALRGIGATHSLR